MSFALLDARPPLPPSGRRRPFELKGGHVLALMALFFATVIAVNVAFITLAVRSFPGEDVKRSYVQGLRYNETLKERQRQDAFGWRVGASLSEGADGVEVLVRIVDADQRPLNDLEVTGALRRPVDARADHPLEFHSVGDGLYRADVSKLEPGQWELRARAAAPDRQRDFIRRLTWSPLTQR